jgi:hypothetical protein
MCTVEARDETAAGAVDVSLFDLEQRKRPVLGGSRRDRSALHCAATVMAVTKCPIPAHTVIAFTVLPRATCQCDRTDYWMARAGLMERIMRKTTMNLEVREPKDELRDAELKKMGAVI